MRVDYRVQFPEGVAALVKLEDALRESPLEPALLELVRVRASQINGCAYCLASRVCIARQYAQPLICDARTRTSSSSPGSSRLSRSASSSLTSAATPLGNCTR